MESYGSKDNKFDTDMVFSHTQLAVLCEKGNTTTQLTLDDDYNLPEYKADIVGIISAQGDVKLDEVSAEDGLVKLRGALQFQVLYRSTKEEGLISVLIGEIPFQEAIRMETAAGDCDVHVTADIEDLTVSAINSRKLQIRSLITVAINLKKTENFELPTETTSDEDLLQLKTAAVQTLTMDSHKKDTLRIREDVALSSNKPSIDEILSYTLQLRGIDCRVAEGMINVNGELFIHMLYRSTSGNGEVQCLETSLPIRSELEAPEAEPDLISWITTRLLSSELEPREDLDGEIRLIHVVAVIELQEWLWEEKTTGLIEDVYSLDGKLEGVTKHVALPKLLIKNDSKFRMNERISIESTEPVIQLCGCFGTIQIEHTNQVESGIEVNGLLKLRLLMIVANDDNPLVSMNATLPFTEVVEIPQMQGDTTLTYQLDAGIDQLSTTLLDSGMAECKAGIRLSVIAFENREYTYVGSMAYAEGPKKDADRPGMIGVYVQPGEDLWSVAKKYMLREEDIRKWNPDIGDDVKAGDKILIIRQLS